MPFCHSSRNDARNINWWILFLSSHDIKAQAFLSLWQLHHSWVWMAFACSKCSNCCLEEKNDWFGYLGGMLFICRKKSFLWKHFSILLWHFLIIWKYFKIIKALCQCFWNKGINRGTKSLSVLSKIIQKVTSRAKSRQKKPYSVVVHPYDH